MHNNFDPIVYVALQISFIAVNIIDIWYQLWTVILSKIERVAMKLKWRFSEPFFFCHLSDIGRCSMIVNMLTCERWRDGPWIKRFKIILLTLVRSNWSRSQGGLPPQQRQHNECNKEFETTKTRWCWEIWWFLLTWWFCNGIAWSWVALYLLLPDHQNCSSTPSTLLDFE